MKLFIANKNYSSWSLRPWLAMRVAGLEFTEEIMPLGGSDSAAVYRAFALAHKLPAKVPVLSYQGEMIWDSLAILETLAEEFPERLQWWPQDSALRHYARSTCAEMHSSFMALRSQCPMNIRRRKSAAGTLELDADLARLAVLWEGFTERRRAAGVSGEFACGEFSIVDAMYAPVAMRVYSYQLTVSEAFAGWQAVLMALPEMQEWMAAAREESRTLASTDNI